MKPMQNQTESNFNTGQGDGRLTQPVRREWVILFFSTGGASDEWEPAYGTLDEAIEQATCNSRHLNYGRNGFRIVPDVPPNARNSAEGHQTK